MPLLAVNVVHGPIRGVAILQRDIRPLFLVADLDDKHGFAFAHATFIPKFDAVRLYLCYLENFISDM